MFTAIAREGGLGVIHKNMSIENRFPVDRVKRSEHGVITDPFYLSPEHVVGDALALMEHNISGADHGEGRKLLGIITNRDVRFETDMNRRWTML